MNFEGQKTSAIVEVALCTKAKVQRGTELPQIRRRSIEESACFPPLKQCTFCLNRVKIFVFSERKEEHGLEMFFWFQSSAARFLKINNLNINDNTLSFGAASIMCFDVVNTAVADFV